MYCNYIYIYTCSIFLSRFFFLKLFKRLDSMLQFSLVLVLFPKSLHWGGHTSQSAADSALANVLQVRCEDFCWEGPMNNLGGFNLFPNKTWKQHNILYTALNIYIYTYIVTYIYEMHNHLLCIHTLHIYMYEHHNTHVSMSFRYFRYTYDICFSREIF